jgi:hypothetical protein
MVDTAGAGVYYRLSCFDVKWNCNQIPWLWFLEFCAVHGIVLSICHVEED